MTAGFWKCLNLSDPLCINEFSPLLRDGVSAHGLDLSLRFSLRLLRSALDGASRRMLLPCLSTSTGVLSSKDVFRIDSVGSSLEIGASLGRFT